MLSLVALCDFFGIPAERTAEAVERYVKRIIDFSELINNEITRLLISEHTSAVLVEQSYYPFVSDIRRLFEETNTVAYSVEDVNAVLNQLLHQAGSYELSIGITDFLYEDASLSPDLSLLPGPSSTNQFAYRDGERILVAIAFYERKVNSSELVAGIACQVTQDVTVTARIELIEGNIEIPPLPCQLNCSVATAGTSQTFLSHVDSARMFADARDLKELETAIRVAVLIDLQSLSQSASLADVPAFRVRHQLMESADRYAFRHGDGATRRLLRTIVDVILHRNLSQGHAIRISHGGGAAVRMRGADTAWRCDIDHGFHLHLWRCDTGPEFMSVVVHDDVSIME